MMCCSSLWAQRFSLSGKVTDPAGTALPFASVSVDQARYGTITDDSGRFVLSLPRGTHQVRVSYLGHQSSEEQIYLQADMVKSFVLRPEELVLEEVLITDDDRDPAYGIIQLAIDNKEENAFPFPSYTHQAYTKTVIRFQEGYDADSLMQLAKVFGGGNKDQDTLEAPPELKSDLLYLSENLSEMAVGGPNKVKETILSSKVSGQTGQFSFFGNLINTYTPFENRNVMEGIADRGLISPIADQAFFYYKYQLLGKIRGEDHEAYKIRFWPKREGDPVYQGIIYIADSSYAVKELDMYATRKQQLNMLDTLGVHLEYQKIQGKWIPLQTRQHFAMELKFFGVRIPLAGFSQTLMSSYDLQPQLEKKYFGREIIAISDSALNQDSSFWAEVRPIPLTGTESRDYVFKDSLEQIRNSPEYLDSLTRVNRKFTLGNLLLSGKTFYNYRKKTSWRVESLLQTAGYNPMEGFYVAPALSRGWDFEDDRSLDLSFRIRYGFSDQAINGLFSAHYTSNPKSRASWRFEAGHYPAQFSSFEQISPGLNTFYALLYKENYIRLYRRSSVSLEHSRELFNGLRVAARLSHESRDGMENQDDFSLFNKDREYVPNLELDRHSATLINISLVWQPFNQYISTPNGKMNLGSSWPRLRATYQTGLGGLGDEASTFQRIAISIEKDLQLGMLGSSQTRISTGRFLGTGSPRFPDLFHFKGNETVVRDADFDQFALMPYYAYSTTRPYLEGHWEHSFSGFILNKLPLIRKLRLEEYAGLHYLIQEDQRPYLELNVGFEKLLFKVVPLRVDLNFLLLGDQPTSFGYKLVSP